jgi:AmiR/NasT family two-component response regulator
VGVAIAGGISGADDLDERWLARDRVNQACGMVVAQLGIAPADALAVLRAHAYAHDTSLAAIAHQVLSRELDFSAPDDHTTGSGAG